MKHLKLILPLLFPAALTQAQQITHAAYLDRFEGLFAEVKINNRKVLLHRSGLVTIDKLENQGFFNTAVGIRNNAYGAVNYQGQVIAPFTFDEVRLADENDEYEPANNYCFVITKLNGKYGAVDTLGKVICKPEYQLVEPLNARLLKIQRNGRWGWVEIATGKVLQEPVYTDVGKSYVSPYVEIDNNGKKGLAKENGEVVAAPEYSIFHYPGIENSPQFGYEINGKIGLMDLSGKKITPAQYTRLQRGPVAGTFAVTLNGKIGIIDSTGKVLAPAQYTEASPYGSFMLVKQQLKAGVLDKEGKVVLPAVYDKIDFYDGEGQPQSASMSLQKRWIPKEPGYFVAKKGPVMELYDSTGKKLFAGNYTDLALLASKKRVFVMTKNAKNEIGLLRTDGTVILPGGFDQLVDGYMSQYWYTDEAIGLRREDYIAIGAGGKMGLYHIPSGKMVLPVKYTRIEWQTDRLLNVRTGEDKTAMVDVSGKVIKPEQQYGDYTAVAPDRIIETRYENNNKITTLTDLDGKVLYTSNNWDFKPNAFTRLFRTKGEEPDQIRYSDGLLKVWGAGEEHLFLDKQGKEVRFNDYQFVSDFNNGIAIAGKTDGNRKTKYGLINREGAVIYPVKADDMKALDSQYVLIQADTLQGLLRKDGSIFVPLKYSDINTFYDIPYYKVTLNNGYGVLDSTGKEIIPPLYQEIYYYKDNKIFQVVSKEGRYGLLGIDGKVILPAEYEELNRNTGYSSGVFPVMVKKDNKVFYIDEQGRELPYVAPKSKSYND